ncbi:hypothetical protein QFZ91_004951 [Paraburkholderia sp. JPY419]
MNDALTRMDSVFSSMYESDVKGGRLRIGPQQLIRALLLQVLYSIRGERMLTEQISYNRLFHWFVGQAMDEAVCDHSTFSKSRARLMAHDVMVSPFRDGRDNARAWPSVGRAFQRRRHAHSGLGLSAPDEVG